MYDKRFFQLKELEDFDYSPKCEDDELMGGYPEADDGYCRRESDYRDAFEDDPEASWGREW